MPDVKRAIASRIPCTLWTAALVTVLSLAALPLFAVQHPNNERGFSPEKSFQVGDLDNVNLFNGGLTITIPIGIRYPVGGGFSYQLTLVYNSNVWDWDQVSGGPVRSRASRVPTWTPTRASAGRCRWGS